MVCTVVLSLAATAVLAASERPNILLLIGDDHGWPYSGFMGDPIARTPNLDALAAGGTLFTEAQSTSSVCVPALRALLGALHTDQWDEHRDAVARKYGPLPPHGDVAYLWTVPRRLAAEGYISWEGGKLWEGTYDQAGFTQGMATAEPTLFTSTGDHFGRDGWEDGTALDPLRQFLDTTGSKPFFAWIAPLLPHVPYDAPPEFTSQFDQLGLTFYEAGYYANVMWLDALIGAIVAELDARGLRENTLIVYLSDNGVGIDQPYAGEGQGKGTLAELGFRTPLIFNWPGHVPAGVVRSDLVSSLDVPATILDYAGADPVAAGRGQSMRAAVETGIAGGRDLIVGHYAGAAPENNGFFVRTPVWRYTTAADGSEQIFAIADDPFEQVDVADFHTDLLPLFRSDVADWQYSLANPPQDLDVAGRLLGDDGTPAGGEALQLVGRTSDGVKLRLAVLSGADGAFWFTPVPQGTYVLRVAPATGLQVGPLTGPVPITLPFGGSGEYLPATLHNVDHSLVAGTGSIRGQVRDQAGHALAGSTIVVRGHDARATVVVVRSAGDGTYHADHLPAGLYSVTASGGPHAGRTHARLQLDEGSAATLDLSVAIR
jgi:uncharacterized sulfatase